jgi:isopenicillin N synthase-like dioxygenase
MVDRKDLLKSYLDTNNGIAKEIICSLSTALGLEEGARFEDFHANSENSNSTLVLLRYPPSEDPNQVGHNKHTDIGSITVLFTDQWGLQVKRIEEKEHEWEFIEPRAGSAIINIGDSLRFLSGKRLLSCLHRIIPVHGQNKSRHTIAYFLRPSNDTKFVDSNGRCITASEWHDQKYEVFKSTHADQRKGTILTGGIETASMRV